MSKKGDGIVQDIDYSRDDRLPGWVLTQKKVREREKERRIRSELSCFGVCLFVCKFVRLVGSSSVRLKICSLKITRTASVSNLQVGEAWTSLSCWK